MNFFLIKNAMQLAQHALQAETGKDPALRVTIQDFSAKTFLRTMRYLGLHAAHGDLESSLAILPEKAVSQLRKLSPINVLAFQDIITQIMETAEKIERALGNTQGAQSIQTSVYGLTQKIDGMLNAQRQVRNAPPRYATPNT